MQPPIVYIREKTTWIYKQLVRDLATEGPATDEDLNALGMQGWELTAVITVSQAAYYYFKRLAD